MGTPTPPNVEHLLTETLAALRSLGLGDRVDAALRIARRAGSEVATRDWADIVVASVSDDPAKVVASPDQLKLRRPEAAREVVRYRLRQAAEDDPVGRLLVLLPLHQWRGSPGTSPTA